HVHGEPGTDGFVHVLDLDEEWAYCLDLPPEFGAGELELTALAVSPAGGELAVLDLNVGRLVLASTDDLAVTETVDLPDGSGLSAEVVEPHRLHLGLFPDHVAVGWDDQLQWLARPSLDEVARRALDDPLMGLTSFDSTLLAWPQDLRSGPTQISLPTG
ncbi:MAG: hypothetical protein ACR2QK_14050, partial [Acidimicrobiales bacterium]